MPRPRNGDVKQPFHFLATQDFRSLLDFFFAIFLVERRNHFVLSRNADDRRITRRKPGDAPAEKRYDDSIPFRALGFLRRDELDGVLIGKARGTLAFHVGTKPLRKISQRGSRPGRFGSHRHESLKIGDWILEILRRQRSEPLS